MTRLCLAGWVAVAVLGSGCPSTTGTTADDGDGGRDDEVSADVPADGDREDGLDAADDVGGDDESDEDSADSVARDTSRDDVGGPDFGERIVLPPVCGDRVIDPGEACDDGNRRNGDGCDWQCRLGFGDFEYPPPDLSTPAIEPSGPSTIATEADEMFADSLTPADGAACSGLWLRAGGGRFALAYAYDHPNYGVRLRVLDATGRGVVPSWTHETPWEAPRLALAWDDAAFTLFTAGRDDGLFRSRIGADGSVFEDTLFLRGPHAAPRPDTFDPRWCLSGAAWHAPRWLVTAGLYFENWWSLETYTDEGEPVEARMTELLEYSGTDCVDVGATPTGFAIADGDFVVALDTDLSVVGWSGGLRGGWTGPGAVAVGPDAVWVAWAETSATGWPGTRRLWVGAVAFDGSPLFPSRMVYGPFSHAWMEGWPSPGDASEVALAVGPAGAAVVFFEGRGESEPDGWVKILTVDAWGNVRTPPTSVLEADATTPVGWALAAAADADGYGVVTAVPGDTPGTVVLVFRHYAPAP